MKAADILKYKGSQVFTIESHQLVKEAIELLVSHGVGSLVVLDEEQKIVGMITERDILRASARDFDQLHGFIVENLMTRKVIIGLTDEKVEKIMWTMTTHHIRHLPIMSSGSLVGILSIGDVVKARAQRAETQVHYLNDYISGQYPA